MKKNLLLVLFAIGSLLSVGCSRDGAGEDESSLDDSDVAAPRIYLSGAVGDPNSMLRLSLDPAVSGLYFKFGSVVGIRSYRDDGTIGNRDATPNHFDSDDVAFNPASRLSISSWVDIPCFDNDITEDLHTIGNLKKGIGDPCRLVGYKLGKIQSALATGSDAEQAPDNGYWTLLTKDNDAEFVGGTSNYSDNKDWGTVGSSVGRFFPQGVGHNYASPDFAGVFLPAAGFRNASGQILDWGTSGYYWSSSWLGSTGNAYSLIFGKSNVNEQSGSLPDFGYSIRCVPVKGIEPAKRTFRKFVFKVKPKQ